jgi:Xaa-Pro aminopeptidase
VQSTLFNLALPAGPAVHAVVDLSSPIVHAKAIKNAAELAGMREAHLRDAVAICDFLNWLENKVGDAVAP